MIKFARKSNEERAELFEGIAQLRNMSPGIVEKDFYVVLMLEILFHHTTFGRHFAFKGGTSLSKCYNIIKRFSEDIDLVMDWSLLGLTDEEVWQERSNRQQQFFNERINNEAAEWLATEFIDELSATLAKLDLKEFELFVRDEDPQTVIVKYPRQLELSGILPEIRLEIGPLAAWTPIAEKTVTSYVAEEAPQLFEQSSTSIPTVEAKRTFWEKATILHKEAHRQVGKTPTRYSRHYYDLYLLSKTEIKAQALSDLTLLQRVVDFKKKFYMANSAKYEEAVPATLKLLPQDEQLDGLRQDYEAMKPMMFETPPDFDVILSGLVDLEAEIHGLN